MIMGSENLGICSKPVQEDDEEHEEAAEVSENVDPVSEKEEPPDDVDNCAETGYADDGSVGTDGATRHWSRDRNISGTVLRGTSGMHCGSQ